MGLCQSEIENIALDYEKSQRELEQDLKNMPQVFKNSQSEIEQDYKKVRGN